LPVEFLITAPREKLKCSHRKLWYDLRCLRKVERLVTFSLKFNFYSPAEKCSNWFNRKRKLHSLLMAFWQVEVLTDLIRVFVVDCLHLAFIKMYLFIRVLLVFKSARIVVSFITKCAGFMFLKMLCV